MPQYKYSGVGLLGLISLKNVREFGNEHLKKNNLRLLQYQGLAGVRMLMIADKSTNRQGDLKNRTSAICIGSRYFAAMLMNNISGYREANT